MMDEKIRIVPLSDPEELKKCERIQAEAWGADDPDVTPYHVLIAAQHTGGVVLGAYDERGELVGFVFSFIGVHDGKIFLYSHQLAVVPKMQSRGIGYLLKLGQRSEALRRGLDLIRWTFDPLQSKNAYFNFRKLGAICDIYYEDFYGSMRDSLNIGIPSDRFYVEWWIKSPRVRSRLEGKARRLSLDELLSMGGIIATRTEEIEEGVRKITSYDISSQRDIVLVEIPSNINVIKRRYHNEAIRWRIATREVFKSYLSRGYIVTDVVKDDNSGYLRCYYVLEKKPKEEILRREEW
ncbi:MAG: hypothetical protein DRN15_00485 [Thermoprotei archaeon]|nr:MAG: hypothetical protein DRN15_00485 [Thermoprotei archaeon]